MIYNGDLLKINGTKIPHIVSYKVQRAKLWKSSERNMSGDMRGTLIGIFPKVTIQVGYTTQEEIANLTELLDQGFFTVEYFDVRSQGMATAQYYAGDYDVGLFNKEKGMYEPFEVSLIPVSKRGY